MPLRRSLKDRHSQTHATRTHIQTVKTITNFRVTNYTMKFRGYSNFMATAGTSELQLPDLVLGKGRRLIITAGRWPSNIINNVYTFYNKEQFRKQQ